MTITKIKRGSVFGGILLITGSCVGAGMLALPVITGLAGFIPSCILFIFAWLFMTATALLLLEANLALGHRLSLISITEKTLGKRGRLLCWILFIFLFYSLSIAYIAASGGILQGIVLDFFGINIPLALGSLGFTVVFGIVIYLGIKPVDYLNRILMAGLVITYLLLLGLGSRYVKSDLLLVQNWKYAFASLPVLVISFGLHNMIPTLAEYLHGDVKRLRMAVIVGSSIPLIIYLLFEAVMLGIIPIEGRDGLKKALEQGVAATSILRSLIGREWVSAVADSFALFAIVTSFLAQSLSLVDFLSDGLKVSKVGGSRVFLVLLTLLPPFGIALYYPGIFIEALNMAGGFAAVILFGVMPVLMCAILRKKRGVDHVRLLPLGHVLLGVIFVIAIGIFVLQLLAELGMGPL